MNMTLLKDNFWSANVNNFHPFRPLHQKPELTEIMKMKLCSTNEDIVLPLTVALIGIEGIGKTTLANSFCSTSSKNYEYIVWINCSERPLFSSFLDLSKRLQVLGASNRQRELNPVRSLANEIYKKLSNRKCLYVFDDAKDYSEIEDILPGNQYTKFHTIITSTRTMDDQLETIILEWLNEDECITFFENSIRKEMKYTEFELRKLYNAIGGLPLCLQMSVSCINAKECSIEEYIKYFDCKNISLNNEQLDNNLQRLNSIVNLSLSMLQQAKDTYAMKLLNIFGCIETSTVKRKFLESILNVSKTDASNSLKLLHKYAFVYEKTIDNFEFCGMHNSVQKIIQSKTKCSELETIQSILNCKGFLEEKLTFAKRYPSIIEHYDFDVVRKQLIGKLEIQNLLNKNKFGEAVALAELNVKYFTPEKSLNCKYNLGICLLKNRRNEEALCIFECLFRQLKWPTESTVKIRLKIISPFDTLVNKYEVSLWLAYTQKQNDQHSETVKQICNYFGRLRSLTVEGNYIPLNVRFISRVKDIINLCSATILCENVDDNIKKTEKNYLRLDKCSIVDCRNENIIDADFSMLPFEPKFLEIIGESSLAQINVDLSKLPKSMLKLELQDTGISVSNVEALKESSISDLKLYNPANSLGISMVLSKYPKLKTVELKCTDLNFTNTSSSTLRTSTVCPGEEINTNQPQIKLQTLMLNDIYTTMELAKLESSFVTKNLSINLPIFLNNDQKENVLQLIQQSKNAVFKGFHLEETFSLKSPKDTKCYFYLVKHGDIRNKMTITETEFERYSQEFMKRQNEGELIDDLKTLKFLKIGIPEYDYFVGRQTEIGTIAQILENPNQENYPTHVAITGGKGVGKSHLAAYYGQSFSGHCLWINGTNKDSIKKSFYKLASQLNVSTIESVGIKLLFTEIYSKIHEENCLVIIDNAYNTGIIELLQGLATTQPEGFKTFIITTSNAKKLESLSGLTYTEVPLGIFSKTSSVDLFLNVFDSHLNEDKIQDDIEATCDALIHFSTPVLQAIALINKRLQPGLSLKVEMSRYLSEILHEKKEKIVHFRKEYKIVMTTISFLSPDNISIDFVKNVIKSMENISLNNTVFQYLETDLLITLNGESISVHKKIQEVTRNILETDNTLHKFLDKLMNCIRNEFIDKILDNQMIHVQKLWLHVVKVNSLAEKFGNVADVICGKLHEYGKYFTAYNFSFKAFDILQAILGDDHPGTLLMMRWNGIGLRERGDYDQSLQLLNLVHEKCEAKIGKTSIFWLLIGRDIVITYMKKGEYDKSIEMYKKLKVMEKRKGVCNRMHTEFLNLKIEIALVLQKMGNTDKSLKYLNDVLTDGRGVLNKKQVLTVQHNKAFIKLKQMEYNKALNQFEMVLQERENILGVNHPITLRTKYFIALTLKSMGKYEMAFQHAKQVVENMLVPQHLYTIEAKDLLQEIQSILHL